MKKFEVICSESVLIGFLKEFSSDKLNFDEDYNDIHVKLLWKHLLFKEAYLILDISYDHWEKLFKSDPLIRMLEKENQRSSSNIQILPGIFKEYEKENRFGEFTSPIYLTEWKSKELSLRFGRLFLSDVDLNGMGRLLFNDNKFIINNNPQVENTLKSWNDLRSDCLPSTDIVLIDNFIIRNGGTGNVISLVRSLIPEEQVTRSVRLTIITGIFNETPQYVEEKASHWYSEVVKEFELEFRTLIFDVSIGIITRTELNHDRSLLTNYLWLDSGHGFNCFKKNGQPKVKTTIKYIPIFSPVGKHKSATSSHNCWLELRKHAKFLIENADFKIGQFEKNLLLG